MKKLFNCFIALAIAVCGVLGCFAGCSRGEEEAFDNTKSHLYVGFYNAGYGDKYVKDLKTRFESLCATEPFEDGKVGVQIHIVEINEGNNFVNQIENSEVDVFFTSNADYYRYVNNDLLLNIDDVVKGSLTEFGERGTIEGKMDEATADFFETDNGYFALPYVTSNWGMILNVDLWEDKELYFAKGGAPSEYLRTNPACDDALPGDWNDAMLDFTGIGEKSAGPDGKYGTADDGQPATYEEFFLFCDRCYDQGVNAFHWSGANPTYFSKMMIPMVADYEGYEQMSLNYTFNGTATDLIDVDANGTVTKRPDTPIKNSNGYLLAKQAGKYYVLDFWDRLLGCTDYYNTTTTLNNASHKHTDAQDDFVTGGKMFGKREIAILIDGDWWWNEAQPAFDVIKKSTDGEWSADNMRFEMLSYPKATNEKVGEPWTMLISTHAISGINKKVAQSKVDLAKKFLKFAFTNESNLQFTKMTSCLRPLDYEFTSGYLNGLNYWTKTLIEKYDSVQRCPEGSTNTMYIYNSFNFFNSEIFWDSTIDGKETGGIPTFVLAKKGYLIKGVDINAQQYFTGMSTYKSKSYWDGLYSEYYQYNA